MLGTAAMANFGSSAKQKVNEWQEGTTRGGMECLEEFMEIHKPLQGYCSCICRASSTHRANAIFTSLCACTGKGYQAPLALQGTCTHLRCYTSECSVEIGGVRAAHPHMCSLKIVTLYFVGQNWGYGARDEHSIRSKVALSCYTSLLQFISGVKSLRCSSEAYQVIPLFSA